MPRKLLRKYGQRGALVRVFDVTRDGVRKYVVQWGRDRQQKSFDSTGKGEP